ncbi:DUF5313 family protein [Nocardia cyriacigeorgica]|uniref:DUF5313 family protein n=1 Tax=Nocardia cyriacigeorgica TaxID=135487 RepID=UPI000CEA35C8|nr:DUF5313 family protein [Nocardia cyriacigeorgica]AVH21436.1 hypothetical protein C5B73_08120 [Nocardia cyriacigeorgica]MBF6086132.1 DUF5313 family protein [Nocardia cyriacigeorgica]MBF6092222.1 DUF5313 family protein [Nocardia cyriacigeorgica]MBF6396816.1 DUF5313 family protein [Nocardia cyriacigeorgica]MBF6403526.1 DUF5313 family protein [Nocardia cyriacigeorgica]
MNKPTFRQRIAYDLGRELPADLHEWVVHDLVGHGAMERYLVRFIGPIIPFFALVLLFPGPMPLKIGLIVMMIVPLVIFTVALSYVWRRYRLLQHGLDPGLVDHGKISEHDREMYELRYGHR